MLCCHPRGDMNDSGQLFSVRMQVEQLRRLAASATCLHTALLHCRMWFRGTSIRMSRDAHNSNTDYKRVDWHIQCESHQPLGCRPDTVSM